MSGTRGEAGSGTPARRDPAAEAAAEAIFDRQISTLAALEHEQALLLHREVVALISAHQHAYALLPGGTAPGAPRPHYQGEDHADDRWVSAREVVLADYAPASGISVRTASARLDRALDLARYYPATLQVLADPGSGMTAAKIAILRTETRELTREQKAGVEDLILPHAPDDTSASWRRRVREAVVAVLGAPLAARVRRSHEDERYAQITIDGAIGYLFAELPAAQARALDLALDALADTADRDDPRTRHQLRADALITCVLGPAVFRTPPGHTPQSDDDTPVAADRSTPIDTTAHRDGERNEDIEDNEDARIGPIDTGGLLEHALWDDEHVMGLVDPEQAARVTELWELIRQLAARINLTIPRPPQVHLDVTIPVDLLAGADRAARAATGADPPRDGERAGPPDNELADTDGAGDTATGDAFTTRHSAFIDGIGPVDADLARHLAGDARWRRILSDPHTGIVYDVGATRYRIPAAMRRRVLARDVTCRFPACSRAARGCHLDHVTPFPHGPTADHNLIALCAMHHRIKHHSRWRLIMHPDASIDWISPTGRRYTTCPADRTMPPNRHTTMSAGAREKAA